MIFMIRINSIFLLYKPFLIHPNMAIKGMNMKQRKKGLGLLQRSDELDLFFLYQGDRRVISLANFSHHEKAKIVAKKESLFCEPHNLRVKPKLTVRPENYQTRFLILSYVTYFMSATKE